MRGIFGLKICGKNSDEKFKWQKVITKIKSVNLNQKKMQVKNQLKES
jgi:hypothetical protein